MENEIEILRKEAKKVRIVEDEETRSKKIDIINKASRGRRPAHYKNNNIDSSSNDDENVQQNAAEERILYSLRFPSMKDRYHRLAMTYKTFEWIFSDPRPQDRPWSSFAEWLRSEDGIYWINGKPGSGKSVLMRFLCNHHRTKSLVAEWADDMRFDLASFFFWNSGSAIQKSQVGLLRSLLHDLLDKHRDLIPIALPTQWDQELISPTEFYEDFDWTLESLSSALKLLSEQDSLKICLFIDGLDEFEGDREGNYGEIVQLFARIATSGKIKLCISSRPLPAFVEAFGNLPSMKLQDLIVDDMKSYTHNRFMECPQTKQLSTTCAEEYDKLIQQIVTQASGVFLWVKLAVSFLLEVLGNTRSDTTLGELSKLRETLGSLPNDLDELYKHILDQLPSEHQQETSRIFQIVRAAREQTYNSTPEVYLLALTFADDHDQTLLYSIDTKSLSLEEITARCEYMRYRLKSHCAGLLDVSDGTSDPLDSTIQYIHRTSRDFLELPRIWEKLLLQTPAFDPKTALVKSYVLQLKLIMVSNDGDDFDEVSLLANSALLHAREAEDAGGDGNVRLLTELDRIATEHYHNCNIDNGDHWATHCLSDIKRHELNPNSTFRPSPLHDDNFLSLTIKYGLTKYTQATLSQNGVNHIEEKSGRPLLDYIVDARCSPSPEITQLLLHHGSNPNETYQGRSTWQHLLTSTRESLQIPGPSLLACWSQIFKQFIVAGADPNACVKRIQDRSFTISGEVEKTQVFLLSARTIVEEMFGEGTDVLGLLVQRGAVRVEKCLRKGNIEMAWLEMKRPLREDVILAAVEEARVQG